LARIVEHLGQLGLETTRGVVRDLRANGQHQDKHQGEEDEAMLDLFSLPSASVSSVE
jgi:hypothetical protein